MEPSPINPIPSPHPNSVNPDTTPEHYNNSLGAQEEQTKSPSQSRGNTYTPITPTQPSIQPSTAPGPRTNSAISQDGQPQTLSQTIGEPPSPHPPPSRTPLLIVSYPKLAYHNPLSGHGECPPTHTTPTQSRVNPGNAPPRPNWTPSWYRLKPLNNHPGL